MNRCYILAFGIVIGAYSQINLAGEITDKYTSGDTLTAEKLNNIKSAVNDNSQSINNFAGQAVLNASKIDYMFGGDGSALDLIISSSVDWSLTPPTNPNFGNITIDAGQTLTVPAGTTIRCNGTFKNNGTLIVKPGAQMAGHDDFAFGATPDLYSVGHPGDSFRAAVGGAYYTQATTSPVKVQGGKGGKGIPRATAITSFNSFRIGGGSGTGYRRDGFDGGDGGGLVKIYCDGPIENSGVIYANGQTGTSISFGGGGGGGGIVILASLQTVDNRGGTINANGGNGGPSNIYGGAGGGGGGGIVILAATVIQTGGVINTGGGSPGSNTFVLGSNVFRVGGGAGGASGGDGGDGSDITFLATTTADPAGFGSAGYVIEFPTFTRPYTLLH
jgi:hypothetical protein